MGGFRAGRIGGLVGGIALALLSGQAIGLDLQGHRGARGLAPENTLAAFATALSLGVTTLEMDLGVTRDGVVVVSHDPRLNPDLVRTPDGRWLEAPGPVIAELTLAELRQFDVGRIRPGTKYAERFSEQQAVDGARIPTLAEVIALVRKAGNRAVRLNLETKLTPLEPALTMPPEAFARAVVDVIRAEKFQARTTVQSFDWRTLREIQVLAPTVGTVCLSAEQSWLDNIQRGRPGASPWTAGLDIDEFEGSVPALVAAVGCDVWSPYYGDVDRAAIRDAHRRGLRVVVWTVNDPAEMVRLIDLKVDGIISDYPDRLRAALEARGAALPKPTPVTP